MKAENSTKLNSSILYPSMMGKTKLLILDYDVTRYHSFDLFRHLLHDKEMFDNCNIDFLPFVKENNAQRQVIWYYRNCSNINPYDNFIHLHHKLTTDELENRMKSHSDDMLITPTIVDKRLGIIFSRQDISGYLLKYTWDPHLPEFHQSLAHIYTTDHMLNLNMAIAIIKQHRINTVMLSSVDVAVLLAERLAKLNYDISVSFIIGHFFYNYDPTTKLMRHIPIINALEYRYKHEFGIFEAYIIEGGI